MNKTLREEKEKEKQEKEDPAPYIGD